MDKIVKIGAWGIWSILFAVAVGYASISVILNGMYGLSQGSGGLEGLFYLSLYAGGDLIKVVSLIYARIAADRGCSFEARMAVGMFIGLSLVSVWSGFAVTTGSRDLITSAHTVETKRYDHINNEIAATTSRIAQLGPQRLPAIVEGDLSAMRTNRRWTTTRGCAEGHVTQRRSRKFCAEYAEKRSELVAARESQALSGTLRTLQKSRVEATTTTLEAPPHPDLAIVQFLTGISQRTAGFARSLIVALAAEMASGVFLALIWVTRPRFSDSARRVEASIVDEVETVRERHTQICLSYV